MKGGTKQVEKLTDKSLQCDVSSTDAVATRKYLEIIFVVVCIVMCTPTIKAP